MTSQNFPVGSKYPGEQMNIDEARRNHLKTLRQRVRFRTKVNGDEFSEENGNSSRERMETQSSSVMYPVHQHNYSRNELIMPTTHYNMDPALLNNPYYRRYSVASYQPMYLPHVHMPLYYLPQNGVPSVVHPVDPLGASLPQNTQVGVENDDSDDVFVSAGNGNAPSTPLMSTPVAIPCSPATLQQIQSRKRAHSAGDMIGLSLTANPSFFYPKPYTQAQPSTTSQPPLQNTNDWTPVMQSDPMNTKPTNYRPPRKRIAINVTIPPTTRDTANTSHPSSSNANYSTETACSNHCNEISSVTSKASRRKKLIRSIKPIMNPTQHQPSENDTSTNSGNAVAAASNSTKHKTSLKLPQSGDDGTVPVASKPSALKSSRSSKSLPIKKKVVWNDWAREKRNKPSEGISNDKPVSTVPIDESLKNLNIKSIKANPSEFTAKNKIGPYLIGPKLGSCPVKSISQYLVRKSNTNKYYMAKILSMEEGEVKSGKMLLHTEQSLLSLLSSHTGVIQQHGMFKDYSYDMASGKISPRIGLVLDCLTPHEFNSATQNYLNLQQYVIQMKRLSEREAIRIFYSIVSIIYSLHKSNVVHRDLKLGNMVLDRRTRRVTLTNFCLGCHLTSERNLLTDQRGSPAYISPDVLSDKPYAGKPSDMWSLGVVLFTMLHGQFPFYDQEPKKLFAKIKAADYTIPNTGQISTNTNEIIRGLLTLNPVQRLTAHGTLAALESSVAAWNVLRAPSAPAQVVPQIEDASTFKETGTVREALQMSEEELTRAFHQKMISDDEDDSTSNHVKRSPKRKISSYTVLDTFSDVCHVTRDAQPLNHDQLRRHQRLLATTAARSGRQLVAR